MWVDYRVCGIDEDDLSDFNAPIPFCHGGNSLVGVSREWATIGRGPYASEVRLTVQTHGTSSPLDLDN